MDMLRNKVFEQEIQLVNFTTIETELKRANKDKQTLEDMLKNVEKEKETYYIQIEKYETCNLFQST